MDHHIMGECYVLRISQTLNMYICRIPPSIVSAILSSYYVVCKVHLKLKSSSINYP